VVKDDTKEFIPRLISTEFSTSEKTMFKWKSIIFWDMTPCSPLSVNRRFGATYRLHLLLLATCLLAGFLLKLFGPEDGGAMFLRDPG
jgi:hypothetical protein